jgi:hypothetical protein
MPAPIAGNIGMNNSAFVRSSDAMARTVGPPHGIMFITPAASATTPVRTIGRMPMRL